MTYVTMCNCNLHAYNMNHITEYQKDICAYPALNRLPLLLFTGLYQAFYIEIDQIVSFAIIELRFEPVLKGAMLTKME